MTILQNLSMADNKGKPFGLTPGTNRKKLEAYRAMLAPLGLGLEDKMDVPVGSLSGGQRQTLALLMATMTPIDFLILDEHTAALDPKTAEIVMQLTNKVVQEKHLTTLMVTHNLRHAVEYGDRLLMMHQGHVIMDKAGDEKRALKVDDLLDVFTSISIECGAVKRGNALFFLNVFTRLWLLFCSSCGVAPSCARVSLPPAAMLSRGGFLSPTTRKIPLTLANQEPNRNRQRLIPAVSSQSAQHWRALTSVFGMGNRNLSVIATKEIVAI